MATATPKTVASLPLYTVVALLGMLTEVFMRLLGNVAGKHAGSVGDRFLPEHPQLVVRS